MTGSLISDKLRQVERMGACYEHLADTAHERGDDEIAKRWEAKADGVWAALSLMRQS